MRRTSMSTGPGYRLDFSCVARKQWKVRNGMEEVVGSIPTRSTIFSTTCRYPTFQFGSIW